MSKHFQTKWVNRERVLVFATRGISFQHRHLMKDIIKLLPHSKPASKMERKENLFVVNEVCKINTNFFLFNYFSLFIFCSLIDLQNVTL